MNPHQTPATVSVGGGSQLPFRVLNGRPGYINLLDALKAWQIARDLSRACHLPAATSLKHTNPIGAGLGIDEPTGRAFGALSTTSASSPLAAAYLRARMGDPVAAYGDFIGMSETVDLAAAQVIKGVVSDGIVAPGYDPRALELLTRKKKGNYLVIEIDSSYEPPLLEDQTIFGVRFQQRRNDAKVDDRILSRIVTKAAAIPDEARRDLLLATIVAQYSQSNAVCLAFRGQVVGAGVGQQSRIACTRIACEKAEQWMLRSHPRVQNLSFVPDVTQTDRENTIDRLLRWEALGDYDRREVAPLLSRPPEPIASDERREWIAGFAGVALSSDGFIPFRDNIDRAAATGVRWIVQTGGSSRDQAVIDAADDHGMTMAFSGLRLFYH
jgi:phosphoribosylaminoimidazolecarboxamide formyltransferase/IMP cyclohydrolase